jgi:hypothetical protein
VRICKALAVICALNAGATAFSMIAPGKSSPETLYDKFIQPYRDKILKHNLWGKEVRVYEHLEVSSKMEEYKKYASMGGDEKLINTFIDEFLDLATGLTAREISPVINNMASGNIGRPEIELLATNMSIRKLFWNKIKSESSSRKNELQVAIKELDVNDKNKVYKFLSASYRVSNLLRFLIVPDNPDSVTAEQLKTPAVIDGFESNFSRSRKNRMDVFKKRIDSEVQWNMSLVDSIVIDTDKKISFLCTDY